MTAATVQLGAGARSQDDYWRLVYAADHHNWNRRFWIFLDPPLDDVHVVELRESRITGEPAAFRLLDAEFKVVRELTVVDWKRSRVQDQERPEFTRADANSDGLVYLTDAFGILNVLFNRGEPPSCADAADANDDGRLNVTDAVTVLLHIFGGNAIELPWPGERCGKDRTPDDLRACRYDVSRCF